MVESERELITLVEVARIAGQKRSTVGNWKDRIEGFPLPRDKGSRGPLYEKSEIVKWLVDTGRPVEDGSDESSAHVDVDHLRAQDSRNEDIQNMFLVVFLRSVMKARDWSTLVNSDPRELEESLIEAFERQLPFALPMLQRAHLSDEKVQAHLENVGKIPLKQLVRTAESFIGYMESGVRFGQENLPSSIVSLVVGLAGTGRVIFDPAANTGQLLAMVGKSAGPLRPTLIGQEQIGAARDLALLSMKIQRLEADIGTDDAIRNDKWPELRADVVVSNPPWSQRLVDVERLAKDARWIWGAPGSSDGNMAWVQHCLFHLSDPGRAVIVLPLKVLFEHGRSARIRQGIIKAGYLESVIALPAGLLETTKIGFVVLVFAKGRRLIEGGPSSTLMVNLEDQPTELLGRQKRLPLKVVEEVISLHQRVVSGLSPSLPYAAIASYEAIAENGFDLTPKRYVMSRVAAPTPVQFDDALKSARESLRLSLESGRQMDRQLERLLKGQL